MNLHVFSKHLQGSLCYTSKVCCPEVLKAHMREETVCYSNHCDEGGRMSTWKVQVSSEWLDQAELPRTRPLDSFPLNLLEPLLQKGKQAYREGSSEFREVQPHWTSLNHCDGYINNEVFTDIIHFSNFFMMRSTGLHIFIIHFHSEYYTEEPWEQG